MALFEKGNDTTSQGLHVLLGPGGGLQVVHTRFTTQLVRKLSVDFPARRHPLGRLCEALALPSPHSHHVGPDPRPHQSVRLSPCIDSSLAWESKDFLNLPLVRK